MSEQTVPVVIDFTGVDIAGAGMTQPGTKGIFVIKDLKFGLSSVKSTAQVEITYAEEGPQGKGTITEFKKAYFFSEKALPSLQTLVKAVTGSKMEGKMTQEQFEAKMKGKRVALKVTGRVGSNGGGYPELSFGGFCAPVAELESLAFTKREQDDIDAAKEAQKAAISSGGGSDADGGTTGGTPTGKKKEDEF